MALKGQVFLKYKRPQALMSIRSTVRRNDVEKHEYVSKHSGWPYVYMYGRIIPRAWCKTMVMPKARTSGNASLLTDVYSDDGFGVSKFVHDHCGTVSYFSLLRHKGTRLRAVIQTQDKTLQLCPVWKASTTFIRRIFLIKDDPRFKEIINPYNISFSIDSAPYGNVMSPFPSVKKFMFVRNPYSRLFSCYVDKLLAPNPHYWKYIGTRAIRLFRPHADTKSLECGHDLTFSEFVQYAVAAIKRSKPGAHIDEHFMPVLTLCKPCSIKYDFIGKLETFKRDYPVLIEALNIPQSKEMLTLLEQEGDELKAIDAIADSISMLFETGYSLKLKGCLSRVEALRRAWKKMQIRGLIGSESLVISDEKAETITEKDFFEIAKASRRNSSEEERQLFKQSQFVTMFKEVDIYHLETLRKAYFQDFRLFGYEDRPDTLFNR